MTHLSSLLQPICYCAVYYAQIIEACCVTYMIMVIDARISNNVDQQILSNLFKYIKRSLSQPVTSRSQNTFTSQNSVCGHCKFVLTIHTHCPPPPPPKKKKKKKKSLVLGNVMMPSAGTRMARDVLLYSTSVLSPICGSIFVSSVLKCCRTPCAPLLDYVGPDSARTNSNLRCNCER